MNLPELYPVVWSVVGPVPELGVFPLFLVQSKLSAIIVLFQPHKSLSKLQEAAMKFESILIRPLALRSHENFKIEGKRL